MSAAGVSSWQLGPFTRHPGPVLVPDPSVAFRCPCAAISSDGRPRTSSTRGRWCSRVGCTCSSAARTTVGRGHGTSRIGLAVSQDGIDFALEPEPVLFPDDDAWEAWEWPGGCEDPRVVESPDGGFVCLYSGFDGRSATLMVATSEDLRRWDKHGPAFTGTRHARRWSKSGSVVTEERPDGRLVASRLDGRYWMYWGEGTCFAATSDDLVRWTPVEFDATADRYLTEGDDAQWEVRHVPGARVLRPLLSPRSGRFDSLLVEPGPPAVRTDAGVVLVYNGANHPTRGDAASAPMAYQPGQALFDERDPASCVARASEPFLRADTPDEQVGQVGDVCFAQGLVAVGDRWHLYSGWPTPGSAAPPPSVSPRGWPPRLSAAATPGLGFGHMPFSMVLTEKSALIFTVTWVPSALTTWAS